MLQYLQVTVTGDAASISVPVNHRELIGELKVLGARFISSDYNGSRFRLDTWLPEYMDVLLKWWPKLMATPRGQLLTRPRLDPEEVTLFGEVPPLLAETYQKLYLLKNGLASEAAVERFLEIPEYLRAGLGFYTTLHYYDPTKIYVETNNLAFQYIRDASAAIVNYAESNTVRDGEMSRLDVAVPLRKILTALTPKAGKNFADQDVSLTQEQIHWLNYLVVHSLSKDIKIEGTELVFRSPPWPMQRPTEQIVTLCSDKMTAPLVSWVILPSSSSYKSGRSKSNADMLIHLGVVGGTQIVRAAQAALLGGRTVWANGIGYNRTYLERADSRYLTFTNDKQLPESGVVHLVIENEELCHNPKANQAFIHIYGNGLGAEPDWDRLIAQLNKALVIGFDPSWIKQMWEYGLKARIIVQLKAGGCKAVWIDPDSTKWGKIVTAITLGKDPKDVANLTVESVGQINITAEVDVEEDEPTYGEDDE